MDKVTLSQAYISDGRLAADFNAKVGKYYIIEDDIKIPTNGVDFPPDSVLEFRGGSFYHSLLGKDAVKPPTLDPNPPVIAPSPTVRLNGSTVSSPIYCIFPRSVNVTGFNNSLVHADWFRDNTATEGEEAYINRALQAARNCPVTLERRTYILKGSITFPYGTDAVDNLYNSKTLLCPGILELDVKPESEIAAITVNTHYVNLDITRVKGKVTDGVNGGVGIRFIGDSFHCNIKVGRMAGLHKGFDIVPNVNRPGQPKSGGGIQYCRIEFQHIHAKYGFYIDTYIGMDDATEDRKPVWFNENRILGGELSGEYGIYMENEPDSKGYAPMDGLVFENIGFESIDVTPLRICNVSGCKFNNMRLMEAISLPKDKPWIILRNVSYTDISVKGALNPNLIKIEKDSNDKNSTRGVNINAWVQDSKWNSYARFNNMSVMPVFENVLGYPDIGVPGDGITKTTDSIVPILTAYNSMVPSNMVKTIVVKNQKPIVALQKAYYTILDILPQRQQSDHNDGVIWDTNFRVLPRTLNVIMEDTGFKATLDVTRMCNFAPAVFDIYLYAPNDNQELLIKTSKFPDFIIDATQPSHKSDSIRCTQTGLYRLTFDADWNLVVTKITE